MNDNKNTAEGGKNMWLYPEFDGYPPSGRPCLLLTIGGAPTMGIWGSNDTFLAWAPMPTRDRSKEPEHYYERYRSKKQKK